MFLPVHPFPKCSRLILLSALIFSGVGHVSAEEAGAEVRDPYSKVYQTAPNHWVAMGGFSAQDFPRPDAKPGAAQSVPGVVFSSGADTGVGLFATVPAQEQRPDQKSHPVLTLALRVSDKMFACNGQPIEVQMPYHTVVLPPEEQTCWNGHLVVVPFHVTFLIEPSQGMMTALPLGISQSDGTGSKRTLYLLFIEQEAYMKFMLPYAGPQVVPALASQAQP